MICGNIVAEMKGDLFDAPMHMALGHCISRDVVMGGSAFKQFHRHHLGFREIEKDQSRVGSFMVLNEPGRLVYNLITKEKFYDHTTLANLFNCLQEARNHMIDNHVMQLALPRVGCQQDGLLFNDVFLMIENVFRYTSIKVTVFTPHL